MRDAAGHDDALAEREPLFPRRSGAYGAVRRGAAHQRAPFALRLRRNLAELVDGAGEACGSDQQKQHVLTL